jgi:IS30 family transposase
MCFWIFSLYEQNAIGLWTTLYFAHPYCSSERGINENHNGIIQRFLPKGTNFSRVSDTLIKAIQDWITTYPRKILGGYTPLHCFKEAFGLKSKTIELLEACS